MKNRHGNQWNGIEDSNMSTHSYNHLSFDKMSKKKNHINKLTNGPHVEEWQLTHIYQPG